MLDELASPSLFAERRLIVVRGVQDLPAEVCAELEARLADPAEDVTFVLVHKGGAKGKGVVDAARRAGAVVVDCAEVKKAADKLGLKIEASEKKLAEAVQSAHAEIEAVAAELTQDLVSRLTGLAVDKQDAANAVKAELNV
jgi:DNA polymerase-3 subunit delta